MRRLIPLCLFVFAAAIAPAAEDDVVFKSDVSLARVDAQVLDRNNRAITGLRAEDFILREEGKPQQIRNFSSENMPVDVVLLLDVSASMRPHIQRIGSAAHEALRVLHDNDRVAIMVFDRSSRLRLPFRSSRSDVEREFETLLRQESFRGGTDITRGMLDAARYVAREGRRDARRAIVIVTDDQTEFDRSEAEVGRALENANAVLSLILAPDAMQGRYGRGGYPGGGGGYPQGGGYPGGGMGGPSIGGPLGGIILGGGNRGRGRGGQGPVMGGPRTHSAGTAEIARESGGDTMPVEDASAFETTLARIRQRYALHFYLPAGVKPGQERNIEVALSDSARRRYPDAEVRFRRAYMAPGGAVDNSEPTQVTRRSTSSSSSDDDDRPIIRRRPASDGSGASVSSGSADTSTYDSTPRRGGFPRVDGPRGSAGPLATGTADTAPAPDNTPSATSDPAAPKAGGWRKLKPGEQP